jgi:hypothetical protein
MAKDKKGVWEFFTLLGASVGFYFWNENQKKRQIINNQVNIINQQNFQYKQLADAYVKQQKQFNDFRQELLRLSNQDNLKVGIKQQLTSLIVQYQVFDQNVTNELLNAVSLVENKHSDAAAFSLSKIIEQQLVYIVTKDIEFMASQKKNLTFHECLEYAKSKKILNSEEHQFAKGLKEFRNIEAHEINIKRKDSFSFAALITGASLISKIFEHRKLVNI